jgi:hypothetical protein
MACVAGGWAIELPQSRTLETAAWAWMDLGAAWERACHAEQHACDLDDGLAGPSSNPESAAGNAGSKVPVEPGLIPDEEAERILAAAGRFNDLSPGRFVFDENKYSPLKREIAPPDWSATNRHLPIKIAPEVINRPGERSPEALIRVVDYTRFYNPRYVAEPGERVTMCNIAAWDWSRALRVHLPHWMGETEMSANMLFRWVSHPQAGGVYGEGWQPVDALAAQLLANRGVPVFALAENPRPKRHGHVAMVYPNIPATRSQGGEVRPHFATVRNGRSWASNGVKALGDTFRWMAPTYFVHKSDFIVHRDA